MAAALSVGEFQQLVDELGDTIGILLNVIAQFLTVFLRQAVALLTHNLRETGEDVQRCTYLVRDVLDEVGLHAK